jgi:plasmid stabilization system protein ParE
VVRRYVIWTKTADIQFVGILEYWVKRNKSSIYSKKLIKIVSNRTKQITENPLIYKATDFKNVRVASLGNFSIYYKVTDEDIIITAFWDNRQDPKKTFESITKQQNLRLLIKKTLRPLRKPCVPCGKTLNMKNLDNNYLIKTFTALLISIGFMACKNNQSERKPINEPNTHKFYFGTKTLDELYPQYEEKLNQLFAKHNFDDNNFKNLKFESDANDENSRRERLHIPLKFMLN